MPFVSFARNLQSVRDQKMYQAADSLFVDEIKPTPTAVLQGMGPPAINGN